MKERWCFFVGPGKTGSSWLYFNLRGHTEIRLPYNIKESNYFLDKDLQKKSIKELFFDYDKEKNVNLDISNTYIYEKGIANKIFEFNSNAQIIIGYRNPLERIISAFSFKQKIGLIKQTESLYECLLKNKYNLIDDNRLYQLTTPYLEKFGKSNIFIFEFKKIKESPEKLIQDLYDFIGVNTEFNNKLLKEKINPSSSFRFYYLARFSYKISRFLRKNRLYIILNFFKSNKWVQKLLYKARPKVITSENDLEQIRYILESKGIFKDDELFRSEFDIIQ